LSIDWLVDQLFESYRPVCGRRWNAIFCSTIYERSRGLAARIGVEDGASGGESDAVIGGSHDRAHYAQLAAVIEVPQRPPRRIFPVVDDVSQARRPDKNTPAG
jgi:hypothetical protein